MTVSGKMLALNRFRQKFRTTGSTYNFQSLRGGKFNFPKVADYIKLHCAAQHLFTDANAPSMAWRPPTQSHRMLTIDIDLKMNEDVLIATSDFVHLAERFSMVVAELTQTPTFAVVLTRKLRNYVKKLKAGECWASGFHLYVLGLLVSKPLATRIRKECLEVIPFFKEEHPYIQNSPEDILDDGVSPFGSNGIIVLGDRKKTPNSGGGYHIVFTGTFDETSFANRKFPPPEESMETLRKNDLYGWLDQSPEGWGLTDVESPSAWPTARQSTAKRTPHRRLQPRPVPRGHRRPHPQQHRVETNHLLVCLAGNGPRHRVLSLQPGMGPQRPR